MGILLSSQDNGEAWVNKVAIAYNLMPLSAVGYAIVDKRQDDME